MLVRDKIYKQIIKEKDQLITTEKHKKIKKYRNKIFYKQVNRHITLNTLKRIRKTAEIVYSKDKNKANSPSSLIQDSKTITDQKHIAEHFNNFVTSIGKKLQKTIPPTKKHFSSFLENSNNLTFFITPTTVEEANYLISHLKASKSMGASSLPTKIMKQSNDIIASPLAELINKSFQSGIFPDIFKIAKVIPIFKSESRVLCSNYRSISLLSNISKSIEKLMQKRVYTFLEQQNCFYNAQFGFRLSLSTNNVVMSITENIQPQLDQNKFCAECLLI